MKDRTLCLRIYSRRMLYMEVGSKVGMKVGRMKKFFVLVMSIMMLFMTGSFAWGGCFDWSSD